MRKAIVALAALAVLAIPAASRAQEEEAAPAQESEAAPAQESAASHEGEGAAEHGLRLKLGLGAGYGLPMGDERKDHALTHLYSGEIPVELEVSYKLTHAISAGVYAGYGLGLVASDLSDSVESIASLRFGVQGEYEFGKVGPALPFAALRVGYVTESIEMKEVAGVAGSGGKTKTNGWEYLTVIAGADLELAKSFAVGPFVSFAVGQYTSEKPEGGESTSIPSAERAMHEWLTIGVRGAFSL